MIKINKILTVATMIAAMAATAFGGDVTGVRVVSTTETEADIRIAPDGGSSGTINIVAGGTLNTSGELRFGENGIYAEISVQVGGHLQADVEAIFNEGEVASMATRFNVYGTAYMEQMKVAAAGNDHEVVVGNGSDAATLIIVEGYLGKYGDANITINANATMIITGDWVDAWKIDANDVPTDSYIDLAGGTLKVNSAMTATWFDHRIKGNGVLGDWVMTAGTGDDAGYNVYTAVLLVPPGTVFIIQ